jgi:hypothetical protein
MLGGPGGDLVAVIDGSEGSPEVHVDNNEFLTDGRVDPSAVDTNLWSDQKEGLSFDHNIWERVEGGVQFRLATSELTSWGAWQRLGYDVHGKNVDPGVIGPLGGGPTAYQLRPGSEAIGAGANLAGAPTGMGRRDYFGTATPGGSGYDIGAASYTAVPSTRNSNATPAVHAVVTRLDQ